MKSLREQIDAAVDSYDMHGDPDRLAMDAARAALELVAAEQMVYTLSGPDGDYAAGYDKARMDASEIVHALIDSLDVDYTTDTALHPFVGKGALCERCGEARDWHKEEL